MTEAANPYQAPQAPDIASVAAEAWQPVKFFAFSGRIGRLRLLTYNFGAQTLLFLAMAGMGGVAAALDAGEEPGVITGVLGLLVLAGWLFTVVMGFSLMYRRLHDLEQSGWWMLLSLVPVANIGLGLYLLFAPGTQGPNRHGPRPQPNTGWTWAGLAFAVVIPALIGVMAAIAVPAYQDYVQRVEQNQGQR